MKKNILIIGSGISSLTLAILLLRAGHKVRILEQHYLLGGYLHCFKRFGFKFETGGHYMGALGEDLPFQRLLKYLDVYDENDYIPLTGDVDKYQFSGFSFSYSNGYKENISRLQSQFPSESSKIEKYYEHIFNSSHSFQTYYFKTESDGQTAIKYLEITLGKLLDDLQISGDLRKVLEAPCVLHGVSPKDVSFGIHSIMMDSLTVSTHGFRDGGDKLADRYGDAIKSLGGDIHLSHKVIRLTLKDGLVSKVHCENGAEFEADEVIAGIHPKLVFDMVGDENLRPAFKSRLKNINESVPFVGAYLVLKSSLGINPLNNYYFMPDDMSESYHDSSTSFNNQVGFFASPLRTYESGELPLAVLASCPSTFFDKWKKSSGKIREEEYLKAKEYAFEALFKRIDKYHLGFSSNISNICYSSNLTNIRYNPSPTGSAYGIYHDGSVTGVRALGPRTQIPNLYLTGQNSLFPGLLGAAISGLRTAGFFTGIKDILSTIQYE